MNKEFPIPTLDKDSWDKLQTYLDTLAHKLNTIDDKDNRDALTECHILLGLIDMILGRTFEFEEVIKTIKEEVIMNKDYWVLCSDYQVLLCNPPKYKAVIKHYHSDKGIKYEDIRACSKERDKIFTNKMDAIKCCVDMNFYGYDIFEVDIDDAERIVINNTDYESV